jgi:GH15 family glucan-1,4-alpha-glucosidase
METGDGAVRLLDFMPIRGDAPDIVRLVEGVRGRVAMRMELLVRLDYGHVVPWKKPTDGGCVYVAGPDALYLRGPRAARQENFHVERGERIPFVLTWNPSLEEPPRPVDAEVALHQTRRWWRQWSARCAYRGEWQDAVHRSLAVLKALTYAPTGGIVAAPTTSLPEWLAGARNWDYRFCWLRDATLTLNALILGGYAQEAQAWRDWLVRAVGGSVEQLHVLYGPAGERWLLEREASWLQGYEHSRPVRIGNTAEHQFQLDIFGELMDALDLARHSGLAPEEAVLQLQRGVLDVVVERWEQPDRGIWEIREQPRSFTHSKVMCWVALDRGIRAAQRYGLEGPVDTWRRLRQRIHDEICARAYDARRNTFVQSYGGTQLDASLLRLPIVGFLPATDPRMLGTVRAIEEELMNDGLVYRYSADTDDGLHDKEGAFLACSFWLVENYVLAGRVQDARRLFERLLSLRNDVGLLSEEYDPQGKRLLGNFPQGFSHVALVHAAFSLSSLGKSTMKQHEETALRDESPDTGDDRERHQRDAQTAEHAGI